MFIYKLISIESYRTLDRDVDEFVCLQNDISTLGKSLVSLFCGYGDSPKYGTVKFHLDEEHFQTRIQTTDATTHADPICRNSIACDFVRMMENIWYRLQKNIFDTFMMLLDGGEDLKADSIVQRQQSSVGIDCLNKSSKTGIKGELARIDNSLKPKPIFHPHRRPKIFISYSRDSIEHCNWVKHFAKDLEEFGFDVWLDVNQNNGINLLQYMQDGVTKSDYVIIIGTPDYLRKSNERDSGCGVAFECNLIRQELAYNLDSQKFIPCLREGTFKSSFPCFLVNSLGINMTSDDTYSLRLKELANRISQHFLSQQSVEDEMDLTRIFN